MSSAQSTLKNKSAKVLVAMSGGVDSSVSAALLQQQGYDVAGAFITTWHPDFLECHWREERQDAMRVCAHLGIPFRTVDLEEEYRREVADYMIREYACGRTPNPDVMCNRHVKFGAFFERARGLDFDFIATGHYARVQEMRDASYGMQERNPYQLATCKLLAGVDTNKDQSYFLWTLTQNILKHTLFPVGEFEKPSVRTFAREFGLPVAEKKDSQGICFLGKVEMKEFLRRYVELKPGKVLNERGEEIGEHEGALLYTTGQRHGFTVVKKSPTAGPHYVVAKDMERNSITVSERFKESPEFAAARAALEDVNWIAGTEPDSAKKYSARFRYRQPLQECRISEARDASGGRRAEVMFEEPQRGMAPGQSLVLYDGEACVGGGILTKIDNN